jgi:hypothetical protein
MTSSYAASSAPAYRYHAVFTDSPYLVVQAESQHRGHAIIEQVNADLIDGPLAHLPSGRFPANDAWLACAAIAHNLTAPPGHLAAPRYGAARAATTWPTSPAGWPTTPAPSTCTYHSIGPGRPPGTTCSTPSTPHPPKLSTSDSSRRPPRATPSPITPLNHPEQTDTSSVHS